MKLLHGASSNISEAYKDTNPYSVKSAIANGYIAMKQIDKSKIDKSILEQFGITLSEADVNLPIVDELITENMYNPLLVVHQLTEEGNTEGINEIKEAYEHFVAMVNKHATDEVSTKNADLVRNVIEVVNLAVK